MRHDEIDYKTSVTHFRIGKNRGARYNARAKGAKSRDCIGRKGRKESQRSILEGMGSSQETLEQLKEKVKVRKEGPLGSQSGKSVEWHRELATASPYV